MFPINPLDRDKLRGQTRSATPFPSFCVDNFLEEGFAESVLASYPRFDEAAKMGRTFDAVNEKQKVQITDSSKFAGPVAELNRALAGPEFCDLVSYVFDIPNILPDDQLIGGGIHQTGPRGLLDVHIDFNYIEERKLHRRLNILVYFNKNWDPSWGGNIELWDKDVKVCHHSYSPVFNRCVVFQTNEISYHGVTAVKCPEGMSRKSFAAYYYTVEAPEGWDGQSHSTNFKARPDEVLKGKVLMPLENAGRKVRGVIQNFKSGLKKTIKG